MIRKISLIFIVGLITACGPVKKYQDDVINQYQQSQNNVDDSQQYINPQTSSGNTNSNSSSTTSSRGSSFFDDFSRDTYSSSDPLWNSVGWINRDEGMGNPAPSVYPSTSQYGTMNLESIPLINLVPGSIISIDIALIPFSGQNNPTFVVHFDTFEIVHSQRLVDNNVWQIVICDNYQIEAVDDNYIFHNIRAVVRDDFTLDAYIDEYYHCQTGSTIPQSGKISVWTDGYAIDNVSVTPSSGNNPQSADSSSPPNESQPESQKEGITNFSDDFTNNMGGVPDRDKWEWQGDESIISYDIGNPPPSLGNNTEDDFVGHMFSKSLIRFEPGSEMSFDFAVGENVLISEYFESHAAWIQLYDSTQSNLVLTIGGLTWDDEVGNGPSAQIFYACGEGNINDTNFHNLRYIFLQDTTDVYVDNSYVCSIGAVNSLVGYLYVTIGMDFLDNIRIQGP
jgi:hypothetical protein